MKQSNIVNIVEENDIHKYSLQFSGHYQVTGSDAINRANDDYDIGDFHLYEAMASIGYDILEGADVVYFNEMQRLINSRRFYV